MKIYFHYSLEGFSNGYLVGNERSKEALIVDPGVMNRELLDHIEENRFQVAAILVTHSHESHWKGLDTLMKIYAPKIFAADAELGGCRTELLQGDGVFTAAGFAVRYFAAPGHSPDSLMYQIENVLFTGDALSAGRLGTTNNDYGKRNLLNHLKGKLLNQNDEVILMPGHGPPTTVGAERLYNIELTRESTIESLPLKDFTTDREPFRYM
ncbi:MBL fold metallo-hydrolase [Treponema zuelzerae]|uniref:MBL fold metallo-hydrolase n=1 Tax=Teretinema zuelzerae TaxID=156 RepID=A0AAE3JJZ6_9SPIR|nr:MBL fold metallo-hydrolase [Teretinema zuelzerae]MBN2811941.1 MBL fold metallo-hydrolase [Spirochaetales bacterium]MCD1653489.1 MBL fold metallo-hydrolase [Teretinema zuelzerae]